MFVKVLFVATIICVLQNHQAESFSFLQPVKDAFVGAGRKIKNFVFPGHTHDENCRHEDDYTTTPYPTIDIRFNAEGTNSSDQQSDTTSTSENESETVPNIDGRNIIDSPCAGNTRRVNGQCRPVF